MRMYMEKRHFGEEEKKKLRRIVRSLVTGESHNRDEIYTPTIIQSYSLINYACFNFDSRPLIFSDIF